MDYLLVAVIGLIIGAIINYFADVLPSSPGLTHPLPRKVLLDP